MTTVATKSSERIFTVGLTGGIGSGKTAVSDHFSRLGVAVVDADLASRACVEPGQMALNTIKDHFGAHLIQLDGTLDRAALRQVIFSDTQAREWLEDLLHPLIGEYIQARLREADSTYAILTSPLLLETNQADWVDRILVVDVAEETQLARTMARDNNSRAQVKNIIATQLSRAERLSCADDILTNEGNLQQLYAEIETQHKSYLLQANRHQLI